MQKTHVGTCCLSHHQNPGSSPFGCHALAGNTEGDNAVVLGKRRRYPVLVGVYTDLVVAFNHDGTRELACTHKRLLAMMTYIVILGKAIESRAEESPQDTGSRRVRGPDSAVCKRDIDGMQCLQHTDS